MSQKQQPPKPQSLNVPPSASKPTRRRRKKGMCLEDRPVLEPNAAGIDVGAREMQPAFIGSHFTIFSSSEAFVPV